MLCGLSAMVQNIGVRASGIFEGVGQDGQAVERTVGVDRLSEGNGISRAPSSVKGHETIWIAEGAPKDIALSILLVLKRNDAFRVTPPICTSKHE
jgi:hypothetical protein